MSTGESTKYPEPSSAKLSADLSFQSIDARNPTEPERELPRSPHTRASLSDEQAAFGLLADFVRQRRCLPVLGSLSPHEGEPKKELTRCDTIDLRRTYADWRQHTR